MDDESVHEGYQRILHMRFHGVSELNWSTRCTKKLIGQIRLPACSILNKIRNDAMETKLAHPIDRRYHRIGEGKEWQGLWRQLIGLARM